MRDFQDLEEQAEAQPPAPGALEIAAGLGLLAVATYLAVHIAVWSATSLMEVLG